MATRRAPDDVSRPETAGHRLSVVGAHARQIVRNANREFSIVLCFRGGVDVLGLCFDAVGRVARRASGL